MRRTSMCRLDSDQSGREVNQLSSSRYMLGRGVKRKLSDYEAGLVELGGMDTDVGLPYPQQRQLVLDLCLNKLQSCYSRAEPNLRRSVLLANTLRQIQDEMRREGGDPPAGPTPGPALTATPVHTPELPAVPADCLATGGPPEDLSPAQNSPPTQGGLSGEGSLACPGCGKNDGRANSGDSSLPPHPPSEEGLTTSAKSSDSLFESFEFTNSTSYLTDLALDDIFEDIDTSMYDSSDFSSVLAFTQPRSAAAATGTEDGLKSFSSCTSASGLQLCLTDLNDLDHIMEILVGS